MSRNKNSLGSWIFLSCISLGLSIWAYFKGSQTYESQYRQRFDWFFEMLEKVFGANGTLYFFIFLFILSIVMIVLNLRKKRKIT